MGVAVVTGASRGLGAAIAKSLAADGNAVALNYAHDDSGAAAVVAAITGAGGKAKAFRFDVTEQGEIARGIAAITSELGGIDILVNNAVGKHSSRPIEAQTWEYHLEQMRYCVKAPLEMLQGVVADWKARKTGCVVNLGSEVVDLAGSGSGHYAAAKAALIGLTRCWARELGPYGIRVNLIAPGFIPVERHQSEKPETLENYRKDVPLGRMGVPSDIGAMVSFLASSRANFITGQTFAVNGGRTMV